MSDPYNAGQTVTVPQISAMPVKDVDWGEITVTENWGRLMIRKSGSEIIVHRPNYKSFIAAIEHFVAPPAKQKNDVVRWDCVDGEMWSGGHGDYVTYTNYARLAAELEMVRKDQQPAYRDGPDTIRFTFPFTFQDLNDTVVDAQFAADDAGNVTFISATLGTSLVIDATQAELIAGSNWSVQMEAVSDWWAEQDPLQFTYGAFKEGAE